MNDLVQYREPQTAVSIRAQVNLIQEVMQAVMKGPSKDNPAGVHYGVIPGTPKPTLYKPGAEVLCTTFRIAPSYKIEDLSTPDYARYRITCVGTHQGSGIVLGEGVGACSSGEEKYKWRKAGEKEWNSMPENLRRVKYGYNKSERSEYEIKQVRTEPADLDNTILKMAAKRAQVAMTLNVTAASDIFTQDIEDLPEELRHDEDAPPPEVKKPQSKSKTAPQPVAQPPEQSQTGSSSPNPAPAGAAVLSEGQQKILRARMNHTVTDEMVAKQFGAPLASIPASQFNTVAAWLREMQEAK